MARARPVRHDRAVRPAAGAARRRPLRAIDAAPGPRADRVGAVAWPWLRGQPAIAASADLVSQPAMRGGPLERAVASPRG